MSIPTALDTIEDLVLPTLEALGAAWWGAAPEGTWGRLLLPASDTNYLRRFWVGQYQDDGAFAPLIGSLGWQGEIVAKCYSADDASARAGRDLAYTAMHAMTAPAGYGLSVADLPPLPLPSPDGDGIYGRAVRFRVTLRRAG